MKADLHVHSTISDGSMTTTEILSQAKSMGLSHIAFTEHDTVEGCDAVVRQGKETGITVIPAIEISAFDYHTGKKAHILGYNFKDTYYIERTVKDTLSRRHANSLKQIAILQGLGYRISTEMIARAGCIYKQHIMDVLVQTGQVEDLFGAFYQQIFKSGGPCAFDIQYIPAQDAVEAITADGGVAVLAHPYQQDVLHLVEQLMPFGLKGVEVYHPSTPHHSVDEALNLCSTFGLMATGGSDFHGRFEKDGAGLGAIYITNIQELFERTPA